MFNPHESVCDILEQPFPHGNAKPSSSSRPVPVGVVSFRAAVKDAGDAPCPAALSVSCDGQNVASSVAYSRNFPTRHMRGEAITVLKSNPDAAGCWGVGGAAFSQVLSLRSTDKDWKVKFNLAKGSLAFHYTHPAFALSTKTRCYDQLRTVLNTAFLASQNLHCVIGSEWDVLRSGLCNQWAGVKWNTSGFCLKGRLLKRLNPLLPSSAAITYDATHGLLVSCVHELAALGCMKVAAALSTQHFVLGAEKKLEGGTVLRVQCDAQARTVSTSIGQSLGGYWRCDARAVLSPHQKVRFGVSLVH